MPEHGEKKLYFRFSGVYFYSPFFHNINVEAWKQSPEFFSAIQVRIGYF